MWIVICSTVINNIRSKSYLGTCQFQTARQLNVSYVCFGQAGQGAHANGLSRLVVLDWLEIGKSIQNHNLPETLFLLSQNIHLASLIHQWTAHHSPNSVSAWEKPGMTEWVICKTKRQGHQAITCKPIAILMRRHDWKRKRESSAANAKFRIA